MDENGNSNCLAANGRLASNNTPTNHPRIMQIDVVALTKVQRLLWKILADIGRILVRDINSFIP